MFSRRLFQIALCISLIVLAGSISADAQTKKKTTTKKTTTAAAATTTKPAESKPAEPQPELSVKRNSRPADEQPSASGNKAAAKPPITKPDPFYQYEFTQPEFVTNRITIEHDDAGKGTIAFTRRGSTEVITDPLKISDAAMAKLKAAFTALNFHDSTEDYQHERDFAHMGNVRIALTKGGRERVAKFNYTVNKNAKTLMDEYRKISTQAIWIFDVTVARENQPLDGPAQMDAFEGLMKRGEMSDPQQMLPFLRELADDERLPLIARNHATRLISQIEKIKK